MHILLIGGTGTLSTAVRNQAIKDGHTVSIFNRGNNNADIPGDVKVFIGNYKDRDSLLSNFADNNNFDVVVDFLSRIPADIERVYPVFKNNCRQYIFISSACVYRRNEEDFPLVEDSPKPNKNWSYNVEKYECEQKLIELSKGSSSFYTIVRPYITYDERRIPIGIAPDYKYHATIIERIRAGKPFFIWDDGKAITTVTHTSDFAKAVVGLFLNEMSVNEDFHITSDYQYTGRELLENIFNCIGIKPNIVSIPSDIIATILPQYASMLKGDRALNAIFDNSKIKAAVPYLKFETDITKGMKQIFNHYDSIPRRCYDYAYEGQIDKLLRSVGVPTQYTRFSGSTASQMIIYYLHKNLSRRYASKICKILRLS